jgi:hypothetical protein
MALPLVLLPQMMHLLLLLLSVQYHSDVHVTPQMLPHLYAGRPLAAAAAAVRLLPALRPLPPPLLLLLALVVLGMAAGSHSSPTACTQVSQSNTTAREVT